MQKEKNYLRLKKFASGLGVDLFGVADISRVKTDFLLTQEVLKKLDRAVVLGLRLSAGVLEEITNQPTKLYFHHYRTVNTFLDQASLRLGNFIQSQGFLALNIPASQILDWQNQKAHLSHKQLAVLAGLGWIGRNNLLVNGKLGSQLRLVSVLTNMPLKTDKPAKGSCASCLLCLKACPAQAIKENPADFDHHRCFEKLQGFQKQRLVDQYVCGVCVNACRPIQRR